MKDTPLPQINGMGIRTIPHQLFHLLANFTWSHSGENMIVIGLQGWS